MRICSYTAISRKVVGKNVHATIPKRNMGYDQYTFPDSVAVESNLCCFPLAVAHILPWPFVPILSYVFEEQWTENHTQYPSRLSRVLFPTTFLEIAVRMALAFRTNSFICLWRAVNWKPHTIPFAIVACTFSDNLSRNSCKDGSGDLLEQRLAWPTTSTYRIPQDQDD